MTRPGYTCLGAEYFCFQGDETWSLPDHALVELAKRELGKIGLIDPAHVVGGVAIRVPRAYPMYDKGYDDAVATLRDHIASIAEPADGGPQRPPPLQQPGPLDVDGGARHAEPPRRRRHDVWAVNADAEYLEEGELQNPLDAGRGDRYGRRRLRPRADASRPAGTAATAVS